MKWVWYLVGVVKLWVWFVVVPKIGFEKLATISACWLQGSIIYLPEAVTIEDVLGRAVVAPAASVCESSQDIKCTSKSRVPIQFNVCECCEMNAKFIRFSFPGEKPSVNLLPSALVNLSKF